MEVVAVRVDGDRHGLSGAHVGELRFLEVGRDPDVVGHEGQELLADLHVIPRLDVLRGHAAGLGGADLRVRELEPGLLDGGACRPDVGLGRLDLGAGELDLRPRGRRPLLRDDELRAHACRGGAGRVDGLSGHRPSRRRPVACEIGGGVVRVRPRGDDVRRRLRLRRLRDGETRACLRQPAARRSPRGDRLIELHPEVGGVDLDEQVAGPHGLVVGHEHATHAPSHLRRHVDHVAVDESVVGRFMVESPEVVPSSDSDRRQRDGRARDEHDPSPAALMTGRRVGRLGLPAGTAGLLFIVTRGGRGGFAMRDDRRPRLSRRDGRGHGRRGDRAGLFQGSGSLLSDQCR